MLDAWMWTREPKDAAGDRGGLLESSPWTEGYSRVAELAARLLDTRLIYVADREADISVLMARARELGHPADWTIRSQYDGALPAGGMLWADVTTGEALGAIRFTLPSRSGQTAREVRQHLWAKCDTIADSHCGL